MNIKLNYIFEEVYLKEASVDQLKKSYSHLKNDDFEKIKNADPTGGKYLSWLLAIYDLGQLRLDDLYKATEYLELFHELKKRGKFKGINLNQFKKEKKLYVDEEDGNEVKEKTIKIPYLQNIQELFELIEPYYENKSNVFTSKKEQLDRDNLIFEGDLFKVYEPKTYEASCQLGPDTQWCTATGKTDEYYKEYTKNGKLFIFVNKKNSKEKYQLFMPNEENERFGYDSAEFRDKNDKRQSVVDILSKDKKTYDFLMKNEIAFYSAIEEDIDIYLALLKFDNQDIFDKKEQLFSFIEALDRLGRLPMYHYFFIDKHTFFDLNIAANKVTKYIDSESFSEKKVKLDVYVPLTEILTQNKNLEKTLKKSGYVFSNKAPIYELSNINRGVGLISYNHEYNVFNIRRGTIHKKTYLNYTNNSSDKNISYKNLSNYKKEIFTRVIKQNPDIKHSISSELYNSLFFKKENLEEKKQDFNLEKISNRFIILEDLDHLYTNEDDEDLPYFDMESYLNSLFPKFVEAAQKRYDWWDQSEEYDELNGGGICHLIVDDLASVINDNQPSDTEVEIGEFRDDSACHNSLLVAHKPSKQLWLVDIPYYNYEIGGGYDWQKIPDVTFDESMVRIENWSGEYDEYIDENGDWLDF